jgi:hypothetical protein
MKLSNNLLAAASVLGADVEIWSLLIGIKGFASPSRRSRQEKREKRRQASDDLLKYYNQAKYIDNLL